MKRKTLGYLLLTVILLFSIKREAYALVTLNANFEDGTFDSLTGNSTWEGPLGSYFGKGVYYNHEIVSTPAIGNYSAAITIGSGPDTAAYLFTYVPGATTTGYGRYKASYYIPSDTVPSTWWNVWQWKSINNVYNKPVIQLNIGKVGEELQIRMAHCIGGTDEFPTQSFAQTNPIPFPTDTWVEITGEYTAKSDTTGSAVIYQDGVEIFRIEDIVTLPGGEIIFWSVNSYADEISPNPTTIYIDNMIVEEVDGFASDPEPEPEPDPEPDPEPEPEPDPDPDTEPDPDPDPDTNPNTQDTEGSTNNDESNILPKTSIFKNTTLNILAGIFLVTFGIYTYTVPKGLTKIRKFEKRMLKRMENYK